MKIEIYSNIYKADPNNSGEITLVDKYKALQVLKKTGEDYPGSLNTNEIKFDPKHPVELLIYPSYDNSVNLFITDGYGSPKVINSGFAKLSDRTCILIDRFGHNNTNEYNEENVGVRTNLFSTLDKFPRVELSSVASGGKLPGGNYILYFKYSDKDDNMTDIICESGIISVFKGYYNNIPSIQGTLANEITDKAIEVTLHDIDTRFSKLYLYYARATSDINGVEISEFYQLTNPFDITGDTMSVFISGYEEKKEISQEELNIQYNYYTTANTQVTVQNMLFLGNLNSNHRFNKKELNSNTLAEATLNNIVVSCFTDSLPAVDPNTYKNKEGLGEPGEYYNPKNIYNKLGYWPNELYKIGIVYIYNDDTKSLVFPLRGGEITKIQEGSSNIYILDRESENINDNGVFLTPNINIIQKDVITPIGFKFDLTPTFSRSLRTDYNIKAYFFVRQGRIPITIAQGLSIGVNRNTGVPTPLVYEGASSKYPSNNGNNPDGFTNRIYIKENYYMAESFMAHNTEYWNKTHWNAGYIAGHSDWPLSLTNSRPYRVLPIISRTTKNFKAAINSDNVCSDDNLNAKSLTSLWTSIKCRDNNTYGRYIRNSAAMSTLHYGLLCTDAYCIPQIQSLLNGNDFYLSEALQYYKKVSSTKYQSGINYGARERINKMDYINNPDNPNIHNKYTVLYIAEGSQKKNIYKSVTNQLNSKEKVSVYFNFGTQVGNEQQVWDAMSAHVNLQDPVAKQLYYKTNETNDEADLLRGNWGAFLAIVPENPKDFTFTSRKDADWVTMHYGYDDITVPCTLYNIKNIDMSNKTEVSFAFKARMNDRSEFHTISDIYNIPKENTVASHTVFRGDCFTTITTTRMQWNFTDPSVPLADTFVEDTTLNEYFHGIWGCGGKDYEKINRGDVNAVQIGYWLTYKSLSNYNLGLRSEDTTNIEEYKKLGNCRSFYPVRGIDASGGNKMPDSNKLNLGYSRTVSYKNYYAWEDTSYENFNFSNRVAFSNVQISRAFTNSFKVFQALSYQDIDSTYGEIVKFEPLESNIFCVFEHGCGIIPINEKALMQTTTGESIHIYGAGVIPEKITIISANYGSIWHDSIIKTPNGIYGVDTSTNKIWRFNNKGFALISDFRVQRWLNEHIKFSSNQVQLKDNNIKAHYNHNKSDVIFTFYIKDDEKPRKEYSICYNESLEIFTCRYNWYPLESSNIDNKFYSFPLAPKEGNKYYLYEHGRLGDTNIKTTYWYDDQKKFEFEFIVSNPIGLHKIFDNLMILSNNAEPETLKVYIIGDCYTFKKDVSDDDFYKAAVNNKAISETRVTKDLDIDSNRDSVNDKEALVDPLTKETYLEITQDMLSIKEYGRRLGNIEYREDMWYITFAPIYVKSKLEGKEQYSIQQARIKDKWARIRVVYSGKKLAVITAIYSIFRISYS